MNTAHLPPAGVFISGHSLTDQPLPDQLAAVAQSLGTPFEWNRHYMVGSSILARSIGDPAEQGSFAGYRRGANRYGEGMDVEAELRQPRTIAGGRYDAMVITEQNGVLGGLVWNDSVRCLRDYHDQFIAGNPQGVTYFYESWLSVSDMSDPRRWIEYERAASPIWQAIVTRINVSLQAEGRADRIISLPAGIALAALVERAVSPSGVPGLSQGSVAQTLAQLFSDEVHLTELGSYYMALVTYCALYRRDPARAWAPADCPAPLAADLQRFAWEFISTYYAAYSPMSLVEARARILGGFNAMYWRYVRDVHFRRDYGVARAIMKSTRLRIEGIYTFSRRDGRNPFFVDLNDKTGFWLR